MSQFKEIAEAVTKGDVSRAVAETQKVIDAVLNVGAGGTYSLYDRSLGLMNDDPSARPSIPRR